MQTQRIRFNTAEMRALEGMPYPWRCLYLALRWRMDIATGCVGLVPGAGVSWGALRDDLFIEPAPGRKGTGRPKESTVRKWANGLESVGLLTYQTVGKRLIFKLTQADVGYSAKNKQDSNGTGSGTDNSTGNAPSENSNLPPQQDTHQDTPTPPQQDTHQVSGITTNTVVLVGNEQSSPPCPHKQIIQIWGEELTMCPQPDPVHWNGTRAINLKTRWREDIKRQNLNWWRGLFRYMAQSEWMTGRKAGNNGTTFRASLGWLVQPGNFNRVVEGDIS